MSKLPIALCLVMLALSPAWAGKKAPSAQTVSFSGTITITADGKTTTYSAAKSAGKLPAIPDGAVVNVVSGEATFQTDGGTISAAKDDTFSVNSSKNKVAINVTAGAPVLSVGDDMAMLKAGSGVTLDSGRVGKVALIVTKGSVKVNGDNGPTLVAGNSANSITFSSTPADLRDVPNEPRSNVGANPGSSAGSNSGSVGGFGAGSGGGVSKGSPYQSIRSGLLSKSHP